MRNIFWENQENCLPFNLRRKKNFYLTGSKTQKTFFLKLPKKNIKYLKNGYQDFAIFFSKLSSNPLLAISALSVSSTSTLKLLLRIQKNLGGGPFFFRCFLVRGMSKASEKPQFEDFDWQEHTFKTVSVQMGVFAILSYIKLGRISLFGSFSNFRPL